MQEREKRRAEPRRRPEVSLMSEEVGVEKGAWPAQLKLLQHLSGFENRQESVLFEEALALWETREPRDSIQTRDNLAGI